ncbi:MAG: hypothetical protein AAF611_04990 [Bacteroidota bacterium]
MKKYIDFKIGYILCVCLLVVSCANTEAEISSEIQSVVTKELFSEMKKVGDAEGKIVVLEMNNFTKKNYKKDFELIDNTKKVLTFAAGSNDFSTIAGNVFKVTYIMENGDAKITECTSEETSNCLESYKLPSLNNIKIIYTPSFGF